MSKELEKHQKLTNLWFIWNIVEAVILLGGGILAIVAGIVRAQNGDAGGNIAESITAYIIASFIILDGLLRLVLYFAKYRDGDEFTPLVIAGFEISLGIFLILLQATFGQGIFTYTIVTLVAVILMVMGCLVLTFSIFQIARRLVKLTMPITQILIGSIIIGVGVTIEVLYNTESSRQMLVLILTGVILCTAAIAMFVITMISHKKAKKVLKTASRAENGDFDIEPARKQPHGQKEDVDGAVEVDEIQHIDDEDPKALPGPKALKNKKK